jgi:aspartyl/glutamyl-tRNA(Asn/Gln) amidotransferase C subunit
MLTIDGLNRISGLAKLKIPDDEKVKFLEKLNQIFGWMDQLAKIDVSGVDMNDLENMESTTERKDIASIGNSKEDLLSNTEYKQFDMFCVPKIVE